MPILCLIYVCPVNFQTHRYYNMLLGWWELKFKQCVKFCQVCPTMLTEHGTR